MKKYILILLFLLVGEFFVQSHCFTLEKKMNRTQSCVIPQCIQDKIDTTANQNNIYDIMKVSCEYTAEYLEFSKTNNISKGKANCVGYAQLCSAIANRLMNKSNVSGLCSPVVGYVYWGKINLCNLLKSIGPAQYKNFVKDHDFVELIYEDSIYYYDPSLYDYTENMCLTIKPIDKLN